MSKEKNEEKKNDLKQIGIFNYHVWMIPQHLSNISLSKKERVLRKKFYQIIEKQSELIQEELEALREEFADLDEKGEKIVKMKMGNKIQYSITGENEAKLNAAFNQLLGQKVVIDLLPEQQNDCVGIADMLESIDMKLTLQEENFVDFLVKVLRFEEQPKDEEKQKDNSEKPNNEK